MTVHSLTHAIKLSCLQLNWDIFPSTAFCFANYMISMLPPDVKRSTRYIIQELVKYMTELAICVYSFVKYKASSKAFACMLVAIESLDEQDSVSDDAKKVLVSASCYHVVFANALTQMNCLLINCIEHSSKESTAYLV